VLKRSCSLALFLLAGSTAAIASLIATSGVVNNAPVFATAWAEFGANTLILRVENDVANPASVAQGISGLDFRIDGGLTGSLISATGDLVTIARDGTFTTTVGAALDWYRTSGFNTTAIGSSGPDQLILGEPGAGGVYSAANRSIAGNGPHNPFVRYDATFVYSIPGATLNSRIEEFSFFFGTDAQRRSAIIHNDLHNDPVPPPEPVPEAGTLGLFGTGLALIGGIRVRKLWAPRLPG
jgi:hypothetical protein